MPERVAGPVFAPVEVAECGKDVVGQITHVVVDASDPLDIGCGTGHQRGCRRPDQRMVGVDLVGRF